MNASGRLNTCKSNGYSNVTSGARVSNAYITYLLLANSLGKLRVIRHNIAVGHLTAIKVPAVRD
jgi:hypothetical protein